MTKIAVISDIHGNDVALAAVLADLARQGEMDRIIFLGDYFAPGPATWSVLAQMQAYAQARFVRGNADRYLLDKSYLTVYDSEGWQGTLRRAFQWTEERLNYVEYRFLYGLPFFQMAPLGNRYLLAVHGSTRSDDEGLTPETTAADLARMALDPAVAVIVCGHTHIPMDRWLNGVRIVNVGSIGLPFDGDPRACYGLISYDPSPGPVEFEPEALQVELRRVEYDVEQAVARLYEVNHPAADLGAYNMRTGRPQGSRAVYQKEKGRGLSKSGQNIFTGAAEAVRVSWSGSW